MPKREERFTALGHDLVRRRDELEAAIASVREAIQRTEPFAVTDSYVAGVLDQHARAQEEAQAAEEAGDLDRWSEARRDLAVHSAWLEVFDPLQVARVRRAQGRLG
ncbi:hypothetical protein [Arenibaculum pallidiluteum]|uniref:hypothetical protein n=1 Tax=Arenibaculum pallidiluteum TaxID=2812559 RepID=UPI001A971FE3|nr:hypothetical protein [Arenibaculum pallidiluteum]